MTDNVGKPCLLFKGGIVKSANHYYNKVMAEEMGRQTAGTTDKFKPTAKTQQLAIRQGNVIENALHKTAKAVVGWCVENGINVIVIGHNDGWKDKANMGRTSNQNFVQIPFSRLISMITYLAERHGIQAVSQEESYTSKASFLDNDPIPTYKQGDTAEHKFSGHRAPMSYHGHRKLKADGTPASSGYRGLYVSKDGTVINSDLNGSANIGRKAFPNMFVDGIAPDFSKVLIYKTPYSRPLTPKQYGRRKGAVKNVTLVG